MTFFNDKITKRALSTRFPSFIKNAWRIQLEIDAVKVIPDGTLHLWISKNNIFLKGLHQCSYVLNFNFKTTYTLYSLYPWAGSTLLNISMKRLVNRQINFSIDAPYIAKDSSSKQLKLEQYPICFRALKNGSANFFLTEFIKESYHQIIRGDDQLKVADLAQSYCISESCLRKNYYQHIGLSPKSLAKISRINKSIYYLENDFSNSLTDLAYQCGFYDQAHFIREFRQVIGCTPGQFFSNQQHYFYGK